MIGEIRDKETLSIAIQSSLTGHLVLSTIHTNDAVSAVIRMMDMGMESYLIAGTVKCITAQRLVRKLCKSCKVEDRSLHQIEDIQEYVNHQDILYSAQGCSKCSYTGYKGREVISEVLVVSQEIARAIVKNLSKDEILHIAQIEGFTSMTEDGMKKVVNGITTLEEIYRVSQL